MRSLFKSLSRRERPEEIAHLILEGYHMGMSKHSATALHKVALRSIHRVPHSFSSMNNLWETPRPVEMKAASDLFEAKAPARAKCKNPTAIIEFVSKAGEEICRLPGDNHFVKDRLDRKGRAARGLDLSKRQYNKRFRLLKRLEKKAENISKRWEIHRLVLTGKQGLISQLSFEDFHADLPTARFITYFVSRCNLRSRFTIHGQTRPYDEISELLLLDVHRSKTANWFAIAHVFPEQDILDRLSDEQKGKLLASWFEVLQGLAKQLRKVWEENDFNKQTMIVKKGNDSSTWNTLASAWNKARDSWFAINTSLGTRQVLQHCCFGKAMRLIAGDLAYCHARWGDGLDSNTAIWADLPFPWDVLEGEVACTREDVVKVCEDHLVDPVKTGWTTPRPKRKAVRFTATPELVHGVTVSSPVLAKVFRKIGFFSGKKLKVH